MNKIVFLQNQDLTNRIFTDAHMDFFRSKGEVVVNNEKDNPDPSKVKELLKDADIAVTSWGCPTFDRDILDAAPALKLVLHAAGSIKGIVSPELWAKGIRVSGAAEALGMGVAETALGLTIASLKNMWNLSRNTRDGEWSKDRDKVKDIYGVKVGVIGGGFAGKHYIHLMRNFNVDILLYDPFITAEDAKNLGSKKVELEELLELSDVISIHAPSIPATDKMINKERLSIMKDDAILINTARGTIIDEAALLEELKKGRLFACLDVTNPEPPAEDHPFRKLPNVILTPHIAGAVNNGLHRVGSYIAEDFASYLEGKKLRGEVLAEKLNVIA